jgi:hypothetical protein
MPRDVKWTHELRILVYRRLTQEFGPYRTWGMADYPRNNKANYELSLKDIARFISQLTGQPFAWTAIQQQIRWGYSKQAGITNPNHARNYILNKAAAIEAGFICSKDLPSMIDMK